MSRSTRPTSRRCRCDWCVASPPVASAAFALAEAAEETWQANWWGDEEDHGCFCREPYDCIGFCHPDPPDVSRWLPSLAVVLAA
jgi:hypothetical protein